VVLFPKYRENGWKTAANTLTASLVECRFIKFCQHRERGTVVVVKIVYKIF
jgi:hypothetical protein